MASKLEHHTQYNRNKKLLNTSTFNLTQTVYYDWIVTIIFYCSLHLVEKYLATEDKHNFKHFERNNFVQNEEFFKDIRDEYKTLYVESKRARYSCEKITEDDVKFAQLLLSRIEDKLVKF